MIVEIQPLKSIYSGHFLWTKLQKLQRKVMIMDVFKVKRGVKMKKIFIDESGNTGAINFNSKFNFLDQPYFALGGILIDVNYENMLLQEISEIFHKNGIQGELKFTNKKYKNNEKLISELLNTINSYSCELFFDITNKKYKIIHNITDYCVYPYYERQIETKNEEFRMLLKVITDYLYNELSDAVVQKFVNLCNKSGFKIEELVDSIDAIHENVSSTYIKQNLKSTIDSIQNYDKFGLSKKKFISII
ncbi:MAG: DUF3800 domain-containing protein [Desulfosporosinus sp.]|nr:DUF3800 domain-containing protein [Desulfosporosinus sp.]